MNTFEVVLTSILAAIGGSALVVGGLAAWLGSVWKDRIDRQENAVLEIDVDLRGRRIPVYEKLWSLLGVLPKWPRDETMTYERLAQLSASLRDWYFNTGGMYLSRTSREAYGALQDELRRIIESGRMGRIITTPSDDYESVRARCSVLRTRLATDVASRREAVPKSP